MSVCLYLYRVNTGDIERISADLAQYLTTAEIERAERFRHESSRHTAILGRVLIRRVLAQALGRSAPTLEIVLAAGGKPMLASGELHFNLSHSKGEILLAVAPEPVGVDIEQVRQRSSLDDLARHVMHPGEWRRYMRQPSQNKPDFFYRTWVLKEAFLKWRGEGIASGLKQFETCIVPPSVISGWQTQAAFIDVPSDFRGALVTGVDAGPTICRRIISVFDLPPFHPEGSPA